MAATAYPTSSPTPPPRFRTSFLIFRTRLKAPVNPLNSTRCSFALLVIIQPGDVVAAWYRIDNKKSFEVSPTCIFLCDSQNIVFLQSAGEWAASQRGCGSKPGPRNWNIGTGTWTRDPRGRHRTPHRFECQKTADSLWHHSLYWRTEIVHVGVLGSSGDGR